MRALIASLASGAAIVALLLALAAGALYVFQGRLLYPAPGPAAADAIPADVTHIALGETYALLLPPRGAVEAPTPALIFAHGNGEAAAYWVGEFDALRAAGFVVLLLEYPGYAGAGGTPTQQSIRAAMLAAYDALAQRGDVDASRIVAYGRSLGGGAVSELARLRPLAAMAFESSFTTLAELVAEKGYPSLLLRDRYDNLGVVEATATPVFVYHGTRDSIIPYHHAEKLAAAGPHVVAHFADCGHNDCPRPWTAFVEFLGRVPNFAAAPASTPAVGR